MSTRRLACTLGMALLGTLLAGLANADWLAPDATFREAQTQLRDAVRDTAGHGDDVVRLDSLGVALLRLGRFSDARRVLERSLAASPADAIALAGLGRLALFNDDLARAESLLTRAGDTGDARRDLYHVKLRRGAWTEAAALAPDLNDEGRVPLLEALATQPPAVRGEGGRSEEHTSELQSPCKSRMPSSA